MAKILVLEDESLTAINLSEWVESFGHTVITAVTIGQALQALSKLPFDAAIVDIKIGDETSDPVMDELERRSIPFAISSGLPSSRPHAQMPKPYSYDQCKAIMEQLLAVRH